MVALVLRPQQIAECQFEDDILGSRTDPQMLAFMPNTPDPRILHIHFSLKLAAAVQCPDLPLPFEPAHTQAPSFVTFSELC